MVQWLKFSTQCWGPGSVLFGKLWSSKLRGATPQNIIIIIIIKATATTQNNANIREIKNQPEEIIKVLKDKEHKFFKKADNDGCERYANGF